jgi:class 3 adenylate cyclase
MENNVYLQCLLDLERFETLWGYFCLSDGQLYSNECLQAVKNFNTSLAALPQTEEVSCFQNQELRPEVLSSLQQWQETKEPEIIAPILQRPRNLHRCIAEIKNVLCFRLSVAPPQIQPNGSEVMYRQSFIRWQAHFPTLFLMRMTQAKEILEQASASDTIVVMGDIRRSQDLMTYAKNNESFISFMVEFIENTRRLINDNLGIFDKFTGDGFLAYFNKALCEMMGADYRANFLEFVKQQKTFSEEHFAAWCKTIRKLPDVRVGLSLGADLGKVIFNDINSHFIAVGDSIVWASRMADLGEAGETIVNNLLFEQLREINGIWFEPVIGKTKAGEPFYARRVYVFPQDERKG